MPELIVPKAPSSRSLPSRPVSSIKSASSSSGSSLKTATCGPDAVEKKLPRLHSFPAKEVAEEMTLMDAGLLRMIKTSELEDGVWMKKEKKEELAPNIMTMVRSFNRVALLVPTEILEGETPQARAKVIAAYIKIAQECYCHRNYNSLKAVLAGLQSTPVYRLAKTWKELSSKKKRKLDHLTAIMHEDNNWSAYNQEIEHNLKNTVSFIPFLGIFLTTTAFYQTAKSKAVEKRSKSIAFRSSKLAPERKLSMEMYETYHLLEAITVRERLNKLRENSVAHDPDDPEATPHPAIPRHITDLALPSITPPPSSPVTRGHASSTTSRTDHTHKMRDSPLCATTGKARDDNTLIGSNVTDGTPLSRYSRNRTEHAQSARTSDGSSASTTYHDVNTRAMNGTSEHNSSHQSEERGALKRDPSEKRKLFAKRKTTKSEECECGVKDAGVSAESPAGRLKITGDDSQLSKTVVANQQDTSVTKTPLSTDRHPLKDRGHFSRTASHDRRKVWQAKGREVSLSLSSSFGRGTFKQAVGGSLECLLDAVETELPSERKGKEKGVDSLPRSPSLTALCSFDVLEAGTDDSLDFEDASAGSGSDSPSSVAGGENSEWVGQIDSQLSLPTSLHNTSSKSCENLLQESLNASGRGMSVGAGEDLLSASGRFRAGMMTGAAAGGGGKMPDIEAEPEFDSSGSATSVESNTQPSTSKFHFRLPTFRHHRRNSSHPNFSFLKTDPSTSSSSGDAPETTPSNTPSNHTNTDTTTTTSSSSNRKSPPCSSGPFHRRVPNFLRGGPKTSSTPLRRRQRHTDVVPRLRASKMEGSLEPGDLLHQYQFLSLGCCAQISSCPVLRKVLTQQSHNTEAANYKLSFQLEPM